MKPKTLLYRMRCFYIQTPYLQTTTAGNETVTGTVHNVYVYF